MKSRIITGVVGGGLLLAILLLCPDICLNIAFVLVCALAMYEVLIVTRFVEHKGLMAAAVAFSMLTPFFLETTSRYPAFIVILLFVLGLAFVQVLYHETLRVERTGFVFFVHHRAHRPVLHPVFADPLPGARPVLCISRVHHPLDVRYRGLFCGHLPGQA